MLAYETPAALRPDRAAPIGRGLFCWPAWLPAIALVLDATWPLRPAGEFLWLDVAALLCVGWAAVGPGRARAQDWATPMDGRIVAGFVLALLHVIQSHADAEPSSWLHQITATGACFYALGARLRREPRAPDAIWPAFAFIVFALAAFTLACATTGFDAVARASRLVDVHWASEAGLAKVTLLATILCVGRALEPSARALWRVSALVGVVAFLLQAVPSGLELRIGHLANLDEPFYFGTTIVAFLFLAGLARAAWHLARERVDEAWRWRSAAVVFATVVVLLLFGGTTGGEGVRTLTALAGAATIASLAAPRAAGTGAAGATGARNGAPDQARAA
jgi:hypothetical protein